MCKFKEELPTAPYGEELDKIKEEVLGFDRLIIKQLLGIDPQEVVHKTEGMIFSSGVWGIPAEDTAKISDVGGKVRDADGSFTYHSTAVVATAYIMMFERNGSPYSPLRLEVTVSWVNSLAGYYGVCARIDEVGFHYYNCKALKRLKTKPSRMETNWGRRILNELALWNQS